MNLPGSAVDLWNILSLSGGNSAGRRWETIGGRARKNLLAGNTIPAGVSWSEMLNCLYQR